MKHVHELKDLISYKLSALVANIWKIQKTDKHVKLHHKKKNPKCGKLYKTNNPVASTNKFQRKNERWSENLYIN